MLRLAASDRQVFRRPPRPFCRVADRGFLKVQDRQPRADESRYRLVEGDQLGRREIAGAQAIAAEQD
jgi:hypothetical protein